MASGRSIRQASQSNGYAQVGLFDPPPGQPDRVFDSESGIVYDRSGGPFNGRVWMVYTDERQHTTASNDTDIFLRFSDDNGQTWSSPRQRHRPTTSTPHSQFLPRIALDQTTGNVAVSWYDTRGSNNLSFGPNDEITLLRGRRPPDDRRGGHRVHGQHPLSAGISDPSRIPLRS